MPHANIGAGTATQYARTKFSDSSATNVGSLDSTGSFTQCDAPPVVAPEGYDAFETFSLIHDGIIGQSSIPTTQASAVKSSSGDTSTYINGPDNLGSDVADVTTKQLVNLIDAISRGETTVNIIAHSRGACAAILTTHALEAIKNAADSTQTLYEFLLKHESLLETTPPYNNTQISTYLREHKEELSSLNVQLSEIKEKLQHPDFKLNLFAIDPVPGGSWNGTKGYTRWTDPRFYTLPPIVNDAQFIYYKNERTRCFKPIVPQAVSPQTKLSYLSLPGHHGTGSGNLKNQARTADFDDITDKTTLVQQLMMTKLIQFLQTHGTSFKPEFLEQFQKNPLLLYQQIDKHKKIYERFNNTTYQLLGKEQSWWNLMPEIIRERLFGIEEKRIVHYLKHTDTYLTEFLPEIDGFVNKEHLELEIAATFSFAADVTLPPGALLKQFRIKLQEQEQHLHNLNIEKIKHITASLIQLIAQQYIRNHLSKDIKQDLLNEVEEFFKFLSPTDTTEPNALETIKKGMHEIAATTLVQTLQARLAALIQGSLDLEDKDVSFTMTESAFSEQKQFLITQFCDFLEGIPYIQRLGEIYHIALTDINHLPADIHNQLERLKQLSFPAITASESTEVSEDYNEGDDSDASSIPTELLQNQKKIFRNHSRAQQKNPRRGQDDMRSDSYLSSFSTHENLISTQQPSLPSEPRHIRLRRAPPKATQYSSSPTSPITRVLYGIGFACLAFAVCFAVLGLGHFALMGMTVLAGALFVSSCVAVAAFALSLIVQLYCASGSGSVSPQATCPPVARSGGGHVALELPANLQVHRKAPLSTPQRPQPPRDLKGGYSNKTSSHKGFFHQPQPHQGSPLATPWLPTQESKRQLVQNSDESSSDREMLPTAGFVHRPASRQ